MANRQFVSSSTEARPDYVHLDLPRGLAALLVFAAHLRGIVFVDYHELNNLGAVETVFYALTGLGDQAVMVFFVLSGFLISKAVVTAMDDGSWSWTGYAVRRLSRLWVVLIPALLLTACWDGLGWLVGDRRLYEGDLRSLYLSGPWPGASGELWSVATFVQNAFFLQGITAPTFGSNTPLWSLANEFWYYLLFPLGYALWACRGTAAGRLLTVLSLMTLLFFIPMAILMLGSVWSFGVGAMLADRNPRLRQFTARRVVLAGSASVFVALLLVSRVHLVSEVTGEILVGAGFALLLPCLIHVHSGSDSYRAAARFLASISYTLYLVHFPFIAFLAAVSIAGVQFQLSPAGIFVFVGMFCLTLAYAYLIYWLFESRTPIVRAWLLGRIAGH